MAWPKGLSWTKTHIETVGNPDGSKVEMRVQGGPFLYYDVPVSKSKRVNFYLGFRPTSPWNAGFGNEGDMGLSFLGRLMKKLGVGNIGAALRIKNIK